MTIYANNVAGVLAAGVGPTDTMMVLSAGQGAMFPAPSGGDYFWATVIHPTTFALEVVQCTSRSGDTLTIIRGRDATTAIAFPAGAIIEMRLTAQMMREVSYRLVLNAANGVPQLGNDARLSPNQLPSDVSYLFNGYVPIHQLDPRVIYDDELNIYLAPRDTAIAARVQKAGDTMTGTLNQLIGGAGTRQHFHTYGWIGGAARWIWAMETDGAVTLNSYDAAAGSGQQVLRISSDVNGGAVGLRVGGAVVWHGNNFNPATKVDTVGGIGYSLRCRHAGQPDSRGLLYFGDGANYLMFDGSSFICTHNFYAPNLIGTSDARLKKKIRKHRTPKNIGDQVALVSWEWRKQLMDGAPAGRWTGPLAQAVQEFAPWHVTKGPNGWLGLDKAGLALEVGVDNAARCRMLEAKVEELQEQVRQLIKLVR